MPPKRQRLENAHQATPRPTHGREAIHRFGRPEPGKSKPVAAALTSCGGTSERSGPQAAPVDAALPSTSGCPQRARTATPLPTGGRVARRRHFGLLEPEYSSPVPARLAQGAAAAGGLRGRQAAPMDAEETSTISDLSSPSTDGFTTTNTSWGTAWDELETMRHAPDETDDEDFPEGTLLWSVESATIVRDTLPVSPTRLSPPALAGPLNSTMVAGGVPIQDMPPPTIPLRPASSGGTVSLAGAPEPADDATPPEVVFPNEVPPCPLGLFWEMQLEQMREAGVTCSWHLDT
ncbi:hypothetical protein HPB48_006803 [Haemaphysalis longicornis]|uniref:Uncharacterized protein n=1 Tax=Haemaphysalis longicornis TaxID=44386 RepID=A0A9J6FFU1_HAELO|nr:hypothetical protein HPB48_006803 [Haemaphysalis longicornis]